MAVRPGRTALYAVNISLAGRCLLGLVLTFGDEDMHYHTLQEAGDRVASGLPGLPCLAGLRCTHVLRLGFHYEILQNPEKATRATQFLVKVRYP